MHNLQNLIDKLISETQWSYLSQTAALVFTIQKHKAELSQREKKTEFSSAHYENKPHNSFSPETHPTPPPIQCSNPMRFLSFTQKAPQ